GRVRELVFGPEVHPHRAWLQDLAVDRALGRAIVGPEQPAVAPYPEHRRLRAGAHREQYVAGVAVQRDVAAALAADLVLVLVQARPPEHMRTMAHRAIGQRNRLAVNAGGEFSVGDSWPVLAIGSEGDGANGRADHPSPLGTGRAADH